MDVALPLSSERSRTRRDDGPVS